MGGGTEDEIHTVIPIFLDGWIAPEFTIFWCSNLIIWWSVLQISTNESRFSSQSHPHCSVTTSRSGDPRRTTFHFHQRTEPTSPSLLPPSPSTPIPVVTSGASSMCYQPQAPALPEHGVVFAYKRQGFVSVAMGP